MLCRHVLESGMVLVEIRANDVKLGSLLLQNRDVGTIILLLCPFLIGVDVMLRPSDAQYQVGLLLNVPRFLEIREDRSFILPHFQIPV